MKKVEFRQCHVLAAQATVVLYTLIPVHTFTYIHNNIIYIYIL
jgi:hypothetical protein